MRQPGKSFVSVLNKSSPKNMVSSFTVDGVKIDNKIEIVEKFNEYFVGIGSKLASSIPNASKPFHAYLNSLSMNSFSLYSTDANEIIKIVSDFQNKTSSGFDDIPVNIIAEPISQIINCSFRCGIFSDVLKIAKVCPVFKDGERELFNNYRPISILPSFSKIFEKSIYI